MLEGGYDMVFLSWRGGGSVGNRDWDSSGYNWQKGVS